MGPWSEHVQRRLRSGLCGPGRAPLRGAGLLRCASSRCQRPSFAEALGFAVRDVALLDRLYAASAETVLDVVESLSDRAKTAMVFGHNPGFTDLANRLSPGVGEMPTCAVLELVFGMKTWSAIRATPPRTVTLDIPKRL